MELLSLHGTYASQHSLTGSGDATENAARHEAEQDLMYVKYAYKIRSTYTLRIIYDHLAAAVWKGRFAGLMGSCEA